MLSFIDFLAEAQFSDDDFARVLSVFERRLPKLLGAKLYRYGGKNHVEKVGSASRIVYIFNDRAFGVRFKGGHVIGIDVWSSFKGGPSHFIDVHTLAASSLIASISKLAALIKNPKEGTHEVNAVNESVQLDEMARRVDDSAFYKFMVAAYGEDGAQKVTWAQIKTVADDNDVLIPRYIRDQKIGRGLWTSKPGAGGSSEGGDSAAPEAAPKAAKKEPILYIKVTAQDPDTKRFIPAGEVKQAQALYKQIASGMADHKPSEKEMRDPDTLYGHLSQLVDMTCKGTLRSLLIYGGPGTGKTYTIMQTIKQAGMTSGKEYIKMSGKASPLSIYQTLFMFREGGLVVFDDLDSMWGNEDATNILKGALDTSPVREITWGSSSTVNVSKMDKEEREQFNRQVDDKLETNPEKVKLPNQFEFKGRVVFISNLKKDEFDTAIMSRSAKICMDLTPEEILKRMRSVLPGLGGDDVPLKDKEALLDHLIKMHGNGELDAVTMREFVKGLNIFRSGAPNWKDLIQYS